MPKPGIEGRIDRKYYSLLHICRQPVDLAPITASTLLPCPLRSLHGLRTTNIDARFYLRHRAEERLPRHGNNIP